jgi:hypothetical protein
MELHLTGMGGPAVDVDENGLFSVVIGDTRYEADTLAGLRDAVLFRKYKRPAAVRIPFTIIEGTLIRHGVATGVRRIDGSIMVRWEDTGQPGVITWNHRTMKRLGVGESEVYRKLCATYDAAQRAVDRFEQTHGFNLKDEIGAALAAANEGKTTG